MKTLQNQVKEFMVKAGQECPDKPTIPSAHVLRLRVKLIAEELLELCEAYSVELDICRGEITVSGGDHHCHLVESCDAILDLMVVTIGTSVAQGCDLQPGWEEVHRSNMSKFIDGHKREDGKWVKGASYSPAQLGPILEAQL